MLNLRPLPTGTNMNNFLTLIYWSKKVQDKHQHSYCRINFCYSNQNFSTILCIWFFSPAPMLMASLFPVPTPTLIRWHRPFLARSPNIEEWADEQGLAISASKSTITLFTLYPQLTLNNSILPLERTPCLLRITFDPHFKFNAHVKSLVTGTLPCINILKALAGTNCGQQKKTIFITSMYLIQFHFMYAAPIWFPNYYLTIPYSETTNPKLCPPHSHRLH